MPLKFCGVSLEQELVDEFHHIAVREHKPLKELHKEILEQYIREHGEGNPGFTLDQFQDSNMKAIPATMRSLDFWQEYINGMTETEYRDLEPQIQALKNKMDERWKKGFG